MSFHVIEPGTIELKEPLAEGQVAIDKGGTMAVRKQDLALVGIAGEAVVLFDPDTFRIAMRVRKKGETVKAFRVQEIKRKGGKGSDRCRIYLARAIRAIGLKPEAVKGRHELTVKGEGKDGLLTLQLKDLSKTT